MKKYLSAMLAVFLCLNIFSLPAKATEDLLKKEETITTFNRYEEIEFAEDITENGRTYELVDVSSEIVSITDTETVTLKETVYYNSLTSKTVPQTYPYMHDGTEYNLNLQEATYEDILLTGRKETITGNIDFGNCDVEPSPDSYMTETFLDEASGKSVTVSLPFIRLEKTTDTEWNEAKAIPLTVYVYEAEYYSIGTVEVPYNNNAPSYIGLENDLLSLAGYDPTKYKITGSAWTSSIYTDSATGEECRDGELRIERLSASYTAVYEAVVDLPSLPGYNATAIYESELELPTADSEYTIIFTASYKLVEGNFFDNLSPTIIVIAVLLLIALIVLILFVLAKKKKEKEVEQ